MEKFKELVSLCKASVSISVNTHKDYYESVGLYIDQDVKDIDSDIFNEMVKRDTIVIVQVYPNTPIGCYTIYHYDIDKAVDIALHTVKNDA